MTLFLVGQSGCAKSADELLIGRWYSRDMTIRFREDSAVIWNSPSGLALGRYEFSGKKRGVGSDKLSPNLFVDVIRNDQRRQYQFEITFLGNDRLQFEMIPTNYDPNSPEPASRSGYVLKRANDNTLGGAPAQVAQR